MPGWTDWRKLADKHGWYDLMLDWDGPACYELGTGGPRGGRIEPHYVGETVCESLRMTAYGGNGSHLGAIIDDHLRDGWTLYYRAMALPTKRMAKMMQDRLLERFRYDWNVLLNGVRYR